MGGERLGHRISDRTVDLIWAAERVGLSYVESPDYISRAEMTEFSASQLDVLFAEAAAARNPHALQQQSNRDSDHSESTKVPEAASPQSAPWQFVCQLWMAVRKQGVQRTSSKHVCSAACDWSQSDDFFVCKQSGNLHLCQEDRCEYRAASGERTVCT